MAHVTASNIRIQRSANCAPSAGNLQAYEIYSVSRRATLEALAQASLGQGFVAQAPVTLVFCANPARTVRRYGKRGTSLYRIHDATIACAYAQLAATALGLAASGSARLMTTRCERQLVWARTCRWRSCR